MAFEDDGAAASPGEEERMEDFYEARPPSQMNRTQHETRLEAAHEKAAHETGAGGKLAGGGALTRSARGQEEEDMYEDDPHDMRIQRWASPPPSPPPLVLSGHAASLTPY
jgi:hypothetical protein